MAILFYILNMCSLCALVALVFVTVEVIPDHVLEREQVDGRWIFVAAILLSIISSVGASGLYFS
ncbi:MAG: hypothetical protein KTR20_12750 [Cellvibrionaceae bacterium]|nr:hypothetical protein [Cellvibrionaceae bacterium]